MTNTDSLKRDDMQTPSAFEAFEALAPAMRQSLRRAASRGTASLPHELGEGWIMVPLRKGRRQVAYKGARAWGL